MATKTPAAASSSRAKKKTAAPGRAKKTAAPRRPAKKSAASVRAKKTAAPRRPAKKSAASARAKEAPAAPRVTTATAPDNGGGTRNWPGSQVRRGLGVALLGLAGAGRFTAGDPRVVAGPGSELPAEPFVDVALGALDLFLEAGEKFASSLQRRLDPALRRALAPAAPLAGTRGWGQRLLGDATRPLAERGRRLRSDSEHEAAAAVAALLPETIALVMEQLDLTELAIANVDIQEVLNATVTQVDMTGFALDNLDLARLIEASLDSIDFTDVAIDRIDFSRTIAAALEQVDVMALARDQLDPARVAAYLRESVDLSETIRTAPGAVAGEAVRGVRDRVERIVTNRRN